MMPLASHGKRGRRQKMEYLVRLEDVTTLSNDKVYIKKDSVLRVITLIPPPRKNIKEAKEWQRLVMRNIWTVGFHKSFIQVSEKTVDRVEDLIVEVGDRILVRLWSRIGTSYWIEVLVEICQSNKCQSKNTFTIAWDNEGEPMSSSRLLVQYNRGVRRECCTLLDWYSFPALPQV